MAFVSQVHKSQVFCKKATKELSCPLLRGIFLKLVKALRRLWLRATIVSLAPTLSKIRESLSFAPRFRNPPRTSSRKARKAVAALASTLMVHLAWDARSRSSVEARWSEAFVKFATSSTTTKSGGSPLREGLKSLLQPLLLMSRRTCGTWWFTQSLKFHQPPLKFILNPLTRDPTHSSTSLIPLTR